MVLTDYSECKDKLEPEERMRVSTQLLKAIKFIHGAGMCHGKLFDVLGFPKIEPLARSDDEDEEDIRLLDFGESFLEGEQPEKLAQPSNLRVPETIFTDRFDYRLDLWRTGCMFDKSKYKIFILIPLKNYEISKFECKFAENVHDPELQALLEVAQGLMRFLRSNRITADKALDLLFDKI
ncbi:hypothetical protein N7449_009541 [Penicillium cf. viridicatum]|uniref:Protein kinase domain-containing protein n=1 Tax=Penicillium cf. viridicatum TaxID=2972119 RepID=A0A9W9JBJ0_9EURO|nr:hypothetical protein N7449_009541 [Penicillium cf. viridicatum]